MIGAITVADIIGRAMMDAADAVHRNFKRIRSDLREHGFDALADRRRADENRDRSVKVYLKPRGFLGTSRSAFNETADREAVIAPVDQLPLELRLVGPTKFLKAAIERKAIIAAVEFVLGLKRRDGRHRLRHCGRRDQIAATEFDAIDVEVLRDHVQQALAEEIRLEPP